jgi:hypothetical protein
MKKLYQTNKDFKDYVDSYMRNKNVTLEEVLSYKQTQLVGEMYKEQDNFKPCRNMRCKHYEDDYCTIREYGEKCADEI